MQVLYRKGTVRRAKKWANMAFHLNLAYFIATVFFNTNWKDILLVKNSEEVLKPQTFRIDGADPWVMTEK